MVVKVGAILVSIVLILALMTYFYASDKIYPGCAGVGTRDGHRKLIYWLGFLSSFCCVWASAFWIVDDQLLYRDKLSAWILTTHIAISVFLFITAAYYSQSYSMVRNIFLERQEPTVPIRLLVGFFVSFPVALAIVLIAEQPQ